MKKPNPFKKPNPVRSLLLLVLPLLIVCGSAFAESGSPRSGKGWGPPTPEKHVARLTEELGLNEAQAAELLEIFTAADAEREALRAQHEELIRKDMCALHDTLSAQVTTVLTPAQQAQLDEMHAAKKARMEAKKAEHEARKAASEDDGEEGHRRGRHGGKHGKGFPDCDAPAGA